MALAAVLADGSIAGVSRLVFDPEYSAAELAILVRSDVQCEGLGHALLSTILAYARSRGASRAWGDVMTGNIRMLNLARELGATCITTPETAELTRAEFQLDWTASYVQRGNAAGVLG
jgi:acetyltransferase